MAEFHENQTCSVLLSGGQLKSRNMSDWVCKEKIPKEEEEKNSTKSFCLFVFFDFFCGGTLLDSFFPHLCLFFSFRFHGKIFLPCILLEKVGNIFWREICFFPLPPLSLFLKIGMKREIKNYEVSNKKFDRQCDQGKKELLSR
jgi:hypothetical protein